MEGSQRIVPAMTSVAENSAHRRVVMRRRPYIPGSDNLAPKPYPAGYRFVPKDEELIMDYLLKRINNEPIPVTEMCDVNLYLDNPQALADRYPQLGENEWYYFTPRDRKYKNGSRPSRSAGTGYWKATGSDRPIHFEAKVVGFKKSLVFYEGKPPQGTKTNWIMHEYRVDGPPRDRTDDLDMRLDDFVLCRVYKKSERAENPAKKKNKAEKKNKVASPRPDNNPVCCPYRNPVNQAAPLQVVAPLQVAGEKQEQEQQHENVAVDFRGHDVFFSDNTPLVVEREDDVDITGLLNDDYSEYNESMPDCCYSGQYQQQQQQQQPIWPHPQSQSQSQYHQDDSFRLHGGDLSRLMIPNNGNSGMHDYSNFSPPYNMPNDCQTSTSFDVPIERGLRMHATSTSFDVPNQGLGMRATGTSFDVPNRRGLETHEQNLDLRTQLHSRAQLQNALTQSQRDIQHAYSSDHTLVPMSEHVVPMSSILVRPVDDSSVQAHDSFNPDYKPSLSRKRFRFSGSGVGAFSN